MAKRRVVRSCNADEVALWVIDIDWSVTNSVVIGVRVERISSSVGWSVVNARAGFVHVVQAIAVIVQVLNQGRVAV